MNTKICTECGVNKLKSRYYAHPSKNDGLCNKCINCYTLHYREKYAERAAELFEHKGGKCQRCDLRDLEHPEIYEYHHIDPSTKIDTVTKLMKNTLVKLYAEADKCLLLCANCHRKEHARMRKEPKAYEQEQPEEQQQEDEGQTVQFMLC